MRINLNPVRKKSRVGPDLTREELSTNPPKFITRRQYYSQVQALFDPMGFLSPVLLWGKIILRMTWEDNCANLGWDDPLPESVMKEILRFFIDLFKLEDLEFSRSLWLEEVIGVPGLLIFSDGSLKAFGATVGPAMEISSKVKSLKCCFVIGI